MLPGRSGSLDEDQALELSTTDSVVGALRRGEAVPPNE